MAQRTFGEIREQAEKDGGFTPHPEGVFTMQVVSAEVKRGSVGQPQILAKMQTIDPGPINGKTLLNNMSLRKNDGDANGMFFQQMAALGFLEDNPIWAQVQSMPEDQAVAQLASAIVGAQALVTVNHRDYGGLRDNVKSMKPVGSGVATGASAAPVPPGLVQAPIPGIPGVPPVSPVAPASVAPVAPDMVPVVTAPAPAPVPQAAPAPVAPAVAPVAPVPQTVPVMPAAPAPVAPVPAQEASPAPTTPEQVVAQLPSPPEAPF